jgi:hypothetical protein
MASRPLPSRAVTAATRASFGTYQPPPSGVTSWPAVMSTGRRMASGLAAEALRRIDPQAAAEAGVP